MKIYSSLEYSKYNIEGLYIITPDIKEDKRGFYFESWNQEKFNAIINEEITFYQDSHSLSKKNVLRGLHYQTKPFDQGKLVRCIKGEIFDLALDIRLDSITFGKWCGVYLNDNNKKQFWIPSGFAHGFLTISDTAEVLYKATRRWSKDHEKSIIWNDKDLKINWPIYNKFDGIPILSEKDSMANTFYEAIERGETF